MPVYLDNNATTAMPEQVVEAMLPYLTQATGNPSSVHRYGRYSRAAIEQARIQVASLVNAQPSQVVFTSGGTEANNIAILGMTKNWPAGHIAVSAIEHPSVLEPAKSLKTSGWDVDLIGVDQNGVVTKSHFNKALCEQSRLVSVMMANNETGVLQDIAELAKITADRGICFHTDASQAAGKIKIDLGQCPVQLLTLSSHKMYGPRGAGALIIDKSIEVQPVMYGGGQEKKLRSGTENIAAIVGFGMAAEMAKNELESRAENLQTMRDQLEAGLEKVVAVTIFAKDANRLPNTTLFAVEGIEGDALLMLLDKKGFAVSSGSACHSSKTEASHVLKAMAVDDRLGSGAIRVSLGIQNTAQEVTDFLAALNEILQTLRPNLSSNVN